MGVGTGGVSSFLYTGVSGLGVSLPNGLSIPFPTLDLNFAGTNSLDTRITFTRASNATYFDANGVLQTASSGVARFDHNPTTLQSLGLLIEEQRTNSIRNNTMQGAVVGTPGTLPTNWINDLVGVTRQIVSSDTVNGINYVDIRFSGTPTSTTDLAIFPESSTGIAATNSQTWAISTWIAIVAGSLSNIGTTRLRVDQFSSVPTFLSTLSAGTISITSSLTRFTGAITTNNASTAYVRPGIGLSVTNGAAIDITLRIGLPQLEQGGFATSVIPTTASAATRNADVASMTGTNFSSWYNATEGTLFAEMQKTGNLQFQQILNLNDNSTNNGIALGFGSGAFPLRLDVTNGGVSQAQITGVASTTTNTNYKTAATYKVDDFAITTNAGVVATDTLGTVPVVTQMGIGYRNVSTALTLTGHIQRIAYYPVRLSNAQLQALTR